VCTVNTALLERRFGGRQVNLADCLVGDDCGSRTRPQRLDALTQVRKQPAAN
jgi:hypothetical protein